MKIEANIVSIIARIAATKAMKKMDKEGMLEGLCTNDIIEKYEEMRFLAIIRGAKVAAMVINEMKYMPQYPLLLDHAKESAIEELKKETMN